MSLIAACPARSAGRRGRSSRPRRHLWRTPTAIAAALAMVAAGCQAAPPGAPATASPAVAPSPTATPSPAVETASPVVTPTGSPQGSPTQAPLEACNGTNVEEPELLVAVRNGGAASYFLQIVGRDGACNWRIGPAGQDGSVGAVTVAAGPGNTVRVLAASDCATLAEETAAAGMYTLDIRGSTVEFRPAQNVDALALGTPAGPPCTPGG
jgi:hypothetical protein